MKIDRFLSWFDLQGVDTSKVHVRHSNTSGFGLYSRSLLCEKDLLILSIPENLFLKPSFQREDLTGFEHLIVYLLENHTDPYVEFLRSFRCVPQWFDFQNDRYPRQIKEPMTKHLTKYNHSRDKLQQYEEDEFQWAYYAINTRCFYFNMEQNDSKEQCTNLCLIPYLDFVNHSNEPNTIFKFNDITRAYEVRTLKPIHTDEQITVLYNQHSNVDLFLEYGFVLSLNPNNKINIEYELQQILSNEQIEIIKSFNYWNALDIYPGNNDLSWTIVKAIEICIHEGQWSPYDDPPANIRHQLTVQLKHLLAVTKQNIETELQQWTTEHFDSEKSLLLQDYLSIIQDSFSVINKDAVDSYPFPYVSVIQMLVDLKCFTITKVVLHRKGHQ